MAPRPRPALLNPDSLSRVDRLDDLLPFLRDHLDWPYDAELDDITFDETPESLGLDAKTPLPHTIRQLRTVRGTQCPWGVFLLEFRRCAVPRSTVRRCLRALVLKRRAASNSAERQRWTREDLLFVCAHGSSADPAISFIHAANPRKDNAPPRIASFGWSRSSRNRTVAEFNLPHLRWLNPEAKPAMWRDNLAKAFDKEALTKAFYKTLEEIYTDALVPDLMKALKNEDKARQAALLLMNRLLFLYFIQRKGWLDGREDYLIQAFASHRDKPKAHSFYADFVWPLFLSLSLPRNDPSRPNLKVPFLNGGLFEPQTAIADADLRVSNASFAALFDRLLEPYNFTITEDTPLDVDVAVDPEMLGKVFEQLITNRHDTGAYYTPRPIVSYMCRHALKDYLGGHEAMVDEHKADAVTVAEARRLLHLIDNLKVVDPACGSGAYLVGMLHELDRLIQILDTRADRNTPRDEYARKLAIIQNNLYGVDIDPVAVNIARLRLWLSLVVEFHGQDPPPLPNLDFKIEQGDSLTVPAPVGHLEQMTLFRDELIRQFREKKAEFGATSVYGDKQTLLAEINRLRADLAEGLHDGPVAGGFDWWVEFADVFNRPGAPGFDIVVGNPPYVRIQTLKRESPIVADLLKKRYASAAKGNYDLYVVFVELGLKLLKPNGRLAYILPHKFFNAQYGEPLRGLLSKGKHLQHVVHFGDQQVFAGATNYVCLLFLAAEGAKSCRWEKVDDLHDWVAKERAPEKNLLAAHITQAEWNFVVGKGAPLFEKLQKMPVKLGDVASLFVGVQTDADDVFIVEVVSEDPEVTVAYSKFTEEVHEFETSHLKPFLKGSLNTRRYALTNLTKRLIFPYENRNADSHFITEEEYARIFPQTWAYLKVCRDRLAKRSNGKFKDYWHGYVYKKNHTRFEQAKIVVPAIGMEACFAADPEGRFYFVGSGSGGGGGYGVVPHSRELPILRYLLAILNSSLSTYLLKKISTPFRGGYFALTRQFIEQLPIAPIDFSDRASRAEHDALAALAEKITDAKKANPDADTTPLEHEIDQRVYRLYGLTPDEIKLVEETAR